MEINIDDLEDFSRPASRESSENTQRGQYDINATDEEKQDPKLQKAFEEMKRLDELLSACMCREKEATRQRKQRQAELWQELMESLPEGDSENSRKVLNAKMFWALDAPIGCPEKETFESLFQTKIGDVELDKRVQQMLESDERDDNSSEASEFMCESPDEENHGDASKSKKKQRNFVKRNIELVRGKGGQLLLTQAEEERLAEILRDLDEEEDKSARGADNEEDMWAVPVSASQGYTQEMAELERLAAIDSKLCLFQPDRELQSSCTLLKEEGASDIGPRHDGEPQPGEKVLQDIKERRTQEKQLLEIQRQLDLLGQDQEMTNEPESLSEEQLLSLLDACELTEKEPEP